MSEAKKLSAKALVGIIREEQAKFKLREAKKGKKLGDVEKEAKKTKEVDAGEEADTLVKHVDHAKGLKEFQAFKKIKEEERKLVARLKELQDSKRKVLRGL